MCGYLLLITGSYLTTIVTGHASVGDGAPSVCTIYTANRVHTLRQSGIPGEVYSSIVYRFRKGAPFVCTIYTDKRVPYTQTKWYPRYGIQQYFFREKNHRNGPTPNLIQQYDRVTSTMTPMNSRSLLVCSTEARAT